MQPLGSLAAVHGDLTTLTAALVGEARTGDHLVLMSKRVLRCLHERLLEALRANAARAAGGDGTR